MISKQKIKDVLKTIPDPELKINICDLGLIYDILIRKQKVIVIMTLTSIGCPLFSQMADSIKEKIKEIKGVEEVEVNLTFEPPWSVKRLSKKAKIQLGFGR